MEGPTVNLPGIMKLKEKYKFYLLVDEAHSIGAVGPNGRVADYYNIGPKSIDLVMVIWGSWRIRRRLRAIIDRICVKGYPGPYAEPMSIPVLTQVIASILDVTVLTTSTRNSSLTLRNNGSNGHLPVDDGYNHPGPVPAKILPVWMSLPPELASGEEGGTRLCRLALNSFYLHRGLDKLGFIAYGHPS
ncbi:serine palmitoyltransferase component [Marasmius sp. AFHP31]|nr:serine palmitoyltransferase component [Marasmius sp. AFHP31]